MQVAGTSFSSWGFAVGVLQQLVNAVTARVAFPIGGLPNVPPGDVFDPPDGSGRTGAETAEQLLAAIGLATRTRTHAANAAARPLLAAATVVAGAGDVTSLSFAADAPGADWGVAGRECALVAVYVDGAYHSTVPVLAERAGRRLDVNLGPLTAGAHRVELRHASDLAPGAPVPVVSGLRADRLTGDAALVARHAPLLELRDPPGGDRRHQSAHSDAPLVVVPTVQANGDGTRTIEYHVLFSNEDGGTPIRTLYSRYGRGIDYELAYRVVVDGQGRRLSAEYQGPLHRIQQFGGDFDGDRPLLRVSTANNNFSARTSPVGSAERWSPAPAGIVPVGTADAEVMRLNPWTYAVMGKELLREGRAALADAAPGDRQVADPRRYLYLGPISDAVQSALLVSRAITVVLRDGRRLSVPVRIDRANDGGRATAIELPAAVLDAIVGVAGIGVTPAGLRAVVLDGGFAPRELQVLAA